MKHSNPFQIHVGEARLAHYRSYDVPQQPEGKPERAVGQYDVLGRAQRAYHQSGALLGRMDARVSALRETDGRLSQQIGKTPSPVLREKLNGVRKTIAAQIAEIERSKAELVQQYNETMRGFSAPKPVFEDAERLDRVDAVISEFAQRLQRYEQGNRLNDMLQQAGSAEQGLRGEQGRLQAQTDQMVANYESGLAAVDGGKEVRTATRELREAKAAIKRAELEAAANGLPGLKKKKAKLEAALAPEKVKLTAKQTALTNAETAVTSAKDAKAKAEALPAQIQKLEADLSAATDARKAAEQVATQKQLDAAAAPVKADYLTKPKALDAINACNTDADAAKTAVVAGPGRDAEVARIEAKRVKDVQIIRDYFTAKDLVTAEQAKETAAVTALNGAKAKVTAEETTLRIPAAPALPLQQRVDAIVQAWDKRVKAAEKDVEKKKKDVSDLEREIDEKYTQPIQELDAQITPLQQPIDEAKKAETAAQEKVRALGGVAKKPDANEQAKFLEGSRALVRQINREGTYMRQHFSGEQPTEQRTIELIKRRTDVATEIADRTGEEKDVRSALNSARDELRWLRRQADQHEARIAELLPLVQRHGEKYCEVLKKKTTASIGKPINERWQPIQQEIMALQEYMPVTGKVRIEELQKKAAELVTLRHKEIRQETDKALIACDDLGVPEGTIRHALSMLRQEGVFLKKYGNRDNRFAYLQEQHVQLSQKLAALRGGELRREATGHTAGLKDRSGRIETVQNIIETEQRLGKGVNARARADVAELKREQLTGLAKETDTMLVAALNNPDHAAKQKALLALVEEVNLLHTHFLDSSRDRITQLRNAGIHLLTQIATQTNTAVDTCNKEGATEQNFREGYSLLAQEKSFLTNNRVMQFLQPGRMVELQSQENALDQRLILATKNAVQTAVDTKTVADIDTAQKFLRLMEERAPFVAGEHKIAMTAYLQSAQGSLSSIKARSAEREGLERAGNVVDVQKQIDEITARVTSVRNAAIGAFPGAKGVAMREQLQKDMQTLQEGMSRASNAQRISIESLITDISSVVWEKLTTPAEKMQTYKANFVLMMQEAQAKLDEVRSPLADPSVEKYEGRIRLAQSVLTKAQGYLDQAATYRMDAKQVEALRTTTDAIQAEITRTQKIVATYRSGGARS